MEIPKDLLFKITLSPLFWSPDHHHPYHVHREITHLHAQFPLPSMLDLILDTNG